MATDYASTVDRVLVDAIQLNVDRLQAQGHAAPGVLHALGYVWGQDVGPLLAPLRGEESGEGEERKKYDVIFCADLIFNRSEHAKLLKTCAECLDPARGQVIVSYSHHGEPPPGERNGTDEDRGARVHHDRPDACIHLTDEQTRARPRWTCASSSWRGSRPSPSRWRTSR